MTGPVVQLDEDVLYRAGRLKELPGSVQLVALRAYMDHANSDASGPVRFPLDRAIVLRNQLRDMGGQKRLVNQVNIAISEAIDGLYTLWGQVRRLDAQP